MSIDEKCASCPYYTQAVQKREAEVAARLKRFGAPRQERFKKELDAELKRNQRNLSEKEYNYILKQMLLRRKD